MNTDNLCSSVFIRGSFLKAGRCWKVPEMATRGGCWAERLSGRDWPKGPVEEIVQQFGEAAAELAHCPFHLAPQRMARQDAEVEINLGDDGADRAAADFGCWSSATARSSTLASSARASSRPRAMRAKITARSAVPKWVLAKPASEAARRSNVAARPLP
jgi:hypothetical protein